MMSALTQRSVFVSTRQSQRLATEENVAWTSGIVNNKVATLFETICSIVKFDWNLRHLRINFFLNRNEIVVLFCGGCDSMGLLKANRLSSVLF
ncbi:hypothetical protein Q31b_29930 [Novipirellula aureliae]|uniref:Uncharacterized protein n=1 Tax=Novipirellula aureliae TaxID=2527966 RepID=A0A5C6DZ87_9BACT|nr:hypothetical protein Q31b_29930 [Novipirellula aureliae]